MMMKNGWRKKLLTRRLEAALAVMAERGAGALVPLSPGRPARAVEGSAR
jgi:hypothetical protein